LTYDARDEAAWKALERLARRSGNYEKVVEVSLEHADQIESGEARARLLADIGDVLKSKLDDVAQARVAYTRAFCEDPSPAYAAGVEALTGGDRAGWEEVLGTVAETAAEDLPIEKKNELLSQLGEWYLEHVSRADLAYSCYEAILHSEPEHEHALLQAARLLDQRLGNPTAAAPLYERLIARNPAQLVAHEALVRIYEGSDPRAYSRALARWSEASSGPQRLELSLRRAEMAEKLGDKEAARALYQAVLAEQPQNKEALRGLDRVYSGSQRPVELRAILTQQLATSETPNQKVELLTRLATLLAGEFFDSEGAADALEQVLAIDPRHVPALRELCRLYEKLARWDLAKHSYERLVATLPPGPERVSAMLDCARLLEERSQEPEAAVVQYETVLAVDPNNVPALTAVARLYERGGAIDHAIEALDTLGKLESSTESRARALSHAGLLLESSGKLTEAIERHWRALDLMPGSPELGARLKAACLANGDVDFVIDLLEADVQRTTDSALKVKLGVELGTLLLRHKDDTARAQTAAESALAARADDPAAHALLGHVERRRREPRRAAVHYAAAVKRLDSLPRADATSLLSAYAETLFDLGDKPAALEQLDELLRRFADDLEAMLIASDLLFRHGDKERVIACCRDMIERFKGVLQGPAESAVLYRLGESLRLTGRLDEATAWLEYAARGDPQATAPLVALRAVFTAQKRWLEVARTLTRQLERVAPEQRADLFVEIGDLAATVTKKTATAAESYAAALRLRPKDAKILLKLLQLYTAERDYAKVLSAILELAAATPVAQDRARHLLVAARVALDELNDKQQALALVDQALGLAPASDEVAREALVLKRQAGDTRGARRLLEQRIEAAASHADRELALKLATELADEYLADLQGPEAIAVNEAVLRLSGEDPAREEVLADLYESDPARYLEPAVMLIERAVARDPRRPEPYRRLLRLYRAVRNADGVFCICQALVAIGAADAREQRYYEELTSRGEVPQDVQLSAEDWNELVVHPSVDRDLTPILARLEPVLRRERGASLERLGYKETQRLADDPSPMVQAVLRSAALIGAKPPLIFADGKLSRGVRMPASRKPCLALSDPARRPDAPLRQAAFVAGRHVSYLKPGFYSRVLVPRVPALKAWVLGAIRLLTPRLSLPPEMEALTLEAQRVLEANLEGDARDALVEPIAALAQRDAPLDVGAWADGVDLTADRVGLVTSGDLPTALAVIRATSDASSGGALPEREAALIAYSVSPRYLTLRARYGLDVDVEAVQKRPSLAPTAS
jgi:tetratricopeptide (TPR) repeat protein